MENRSHHSCSAMGSTQLWCIDRKSFFSQPSLSSSFHSCLYFSLWGGLSYFVHKPISVHIQPVLHWNPYNPLLVDLHEAPSFNSLIYCGQHTTLRFSHRSETTVLVWLVCHPRNMHKVRRKEKREGNSNNMATLHQFFICKQLFF